MKILTEQKQPDISKDYKRRELEREVQDIKQVIRGVFGDNAGIIFSSSKPYVVGNP